MEGRVPSAGARRPLTHLAVLPQEIEVSRITSHHRVASALPPPLLAHQPSPAAVKLAATSLPGRCNWPLLGRACKLRSSGAPAMSGEGTLSAAAPGAGDAGPSDAGSIHCWSGPRCVSTSLMYSWAQRSDTQVGGLAQQACVRHRLGYDCAALAAGAHSWRAGVLLTVGCTHCGCLSLPRCLRRCWTSRCMPTSSA